MIQPLDQVRSIVASALNPGTKIKKSFETFFIETMILILTIYGKLNFLQLGRHGGSCESRFRQNFKKKFDWCGFNMRFCRLAVGVRSAIALKHMKDSRDNQTGRCLRTIYEKRGQLLALSGLLVGDCLFATYNMVTGIRAIGFEMVSRFRDDAVLQYLYTSPQKQGRDRRKELDGQVDIDSLRGDVFVSETFTLFRDAKQNTGLEDWQSTDSDRLAFGYNTSLLAVNVAREYAKEIHEKTGRRLSVASVKKVLHNAALYQHIKEFIKGQNSVHPQNNMVLSEDIPTNLLFFGVRDSA